MTTAVDSPTNSKVSKNSLAWVDGRYCYVKSGYSAERVLDARSIPGRWFDKPNKRDRFPINQAVAVFAFATKWRIPIHDTLAVLVDDEAASSTLATRYIYNMQIEDNTIVVSIDYSADMVSRMIHNIPQIKLHKPSKTWRTPVPNLEKALIFARSVDWRIDPDILNNIDNYLREEREMLERSRALSTDVDFPSLGEVNDLLAPYQKAGIEYLLRCRKGILGDEQGLGKSIQALATVVVDQAFPMVVVCPQNMRPVWADEVEKWFAGRYSSFVVSGTKGDYIPASDVIIVNYDILEARSEEIIAHGYKSLVVDESHYIKNGDQQYRCAGCGRVGQAGWRNCSNCGLKDTDPVERWTVKRAGAVAKLADYLEDDELCLLLTGTPILNRPTEVIPQLIVTRWMKKLFGNKSSFEMRYCPDRKSARFTKELNDKLRQHCYIRRIKKDVYGELPPLVNNNVYIEPSADRMSRYREVEADVIGYFAKKAREIAEQEGYDGSRAYMQKQMQLQFREHLVRLSALRSAAAEAKLDECLKWVGQWLEDHPDEKLIVFATHVEMVDLIYAAHKDIAVRLRGSSKGGTKAKERDEARVRFQEDPSVRLFVGNMQAASHGLTLTEAYDVAFCELDWTPGLHDQCIARCYGRVNDLHGATAHWILAERTIDSMMMDRLGMKRRIVNAVTEGHDIDEDEVIETESLSDAVADIGIRLAEMAEDAA